MLRRDLSEELALRNLAYLDAGTASQITAAVAAGFAGLVVVAKMYGRKIWRALTFWKKRPASPATSPSEELTPTAVGDDQAS